MSEDEHMTKTLLIDDCFNDLSLRLIIAFCKALDVDDEAAGAVVATKVAASAQPAPARRSRSPRRGSVAKLPRSDEWAISATTSTTGRGRRVVSQIPQAIWTPRRGRRGRKR